MRADLHVHTCYSDGIEEPQSLIERARGKLDVVSICDHDTIAAYDELADVDGVHVVPGVEISTHHGGRGVHLLGYFPDGFTDGFRAWIAELEASRRERVHEGVRSLRSEGVSIRWEHLARFVGPGVPCRSHVCRVLIEMGYARNPRVIFERYLKGGRFAPPPWDVRRCIEVVREHGGIPVWAHPSEEAVDASLAELQEAGLLGVEVFIPRRRHGERKRMAERVERLGLVVTGGTDHHGPGGLYGNFSFGGVPRDWVSPRRRGG